MNPKELKVSLLEEATTEQQKEFAKMLAEECVRAEQQKSHLCWYFIPSEKEYENMKKFRDNDERCPRCKKGRIVIEIFRDSIGETLNAVCRWGEKNCNFKELVGDLDKW